MISSEPPPRNSTEHHFALLYGLASLQLLQQEQQQQQNSIVLYTTQSNIEYKPAVVSTFSYCFDQLVSDSVYNQLLCYMDRSERSNAYCSSSGIHKLRLSASIFVKMWLKPRYYHHWLWPTFKLSANRPVEVSKWNLVWSVYFMKKTNYANEWKTKKFCTSTHETTL